MPHYRFHIYNDIETFDDEGLDLDNLALAHLKAIHYARDLASEAVRQGHLDLRHRIEVQGEGDAILATVTFADAIEITR